MVAQFDFKIQTKDWRYIHLVEYLFIEITAYVIARWHLISTLCAFPLQLPKKTGTIETRGIFTLHPLLQMQMTKIYCFRSFALDSDDYNAGHKYLGHLSKKYEIQESNHFNQSPYCNSVK